jgi:hypothetical protein
MVAVRLMPWPLAVIVTWEGWLTGLTFMSMKPALALPATTRTLQRPRQLSPVTGS